MTERGKLKPHEWVIVQFFLVILTVIDLFRLVYKIGMVGWILAHPGQKHERIFVARFRNPDGTYRRSPPLAFQWIMFCRTFADFHGFDIVPFE